MNDRVFCGLDDCGLLDGAVPHGEILANGAFEHKYVLVNDGEGIIENAARNALAWLTVEKDLSRPRRVKSADEFGNRRLSATRGTHQSDSAARLELESEISDQRFLETTVAERDTVHFRPSFKEVGFVAGDAFAGRAGSKVISTGKRSTSSSLPRSP